MFDKNPTTTYDLDNPSIVMKVLYYALVVRCPVRKVDGAPFRRLES